MHKYGEGGEVEAGGKSTMIQMMEHVFEEDAARSLGNGQL